MRAGVVVQKLGMTRLFSEEGVHIPVTLLAFRDCTVVGHKTEERDGYAALQVGAEKIAVGKLSKPLRGFFEKSKNLDGAWRELVECRVNADNFLDVGAKIGPAHFSVGAFVDVTSTSKGKGFAGVMKRHNFRGLRASHGVSISHRSHGSTGQRSFPGRVFKNKKMAGHLGAKRTTVQSLCVAHVDEASGILAVRGGVPGPRGVYVMVRDAVKKPVVKA